MVDEIIKARVWWKVDSETNWNANPLILGPGEPAWVINNNGQGVNVKIGDGTKLFSQLPYFIEYDQGQFEPIEGTVLPEPSGVQYSIVGPGTYTRAGQPNIVVPSTDLGIIYGDGTTWSLGSSVPLPTTPVSEEFDTEDPLAISGIGIGKGIKNDFTGGDALIASATTVKTLNERVDFFDRPDLDDEHYIIADDNTLIDRFLTQNHDGANLLPDGIGMDVIDRPDMSSIIIVDGNGEIISEVGESSSTSSGTDISGLAIWNPSAQTGFDVDVVTPSTTDEKLINYNNGVNSLITAYDAFLTAYNNPNIDPYITKVSIGNSKVGNIPTYLYRLKPVDVKAKILLMAGTHANEKMYVWGLYHFVRELLSNWQSNSFLEFLRWNVQFDILPCRSPYTLGNAVRTKGFRVIPETAPIPFTWTKSASVVTLTFDVNDFPNDGFLTGSTYFNSVPSSALVNKSSLGIITSSDVVGLPTTSYKISGVISGNSVTINAPDATGATSGTGTFQVWTDPNRNMNPTGTTNWNDYVGSTSIQPGDNGNSVGFHDAKGTRPLSLLENRNLLSLIQAQKYDYMMDQHSPSSDNYLDYDPTTGFVPNVSKILSESGAFVNSGSRITDLTNVTTPYPTITITRDYGVPMHTIEWGSGLYKANSTEVKDAMRWIGVVLKESLTKIFNK
ncbi:MAG: hypothetical protein LBF27_25780 [Sphingobacterium sp.]|jgi:hypothetical protein|nr:hypothetical protein [Sphingobacterium sp.]